MIDIFVSGHGRGDKFTATITLTGNTADHIALIDSLCHADLGDDSPAAKLRDALMDGTPFVCREWPPPSPVIARVTNTEVSGLSWRLTSASALVIDGVEYPIPARHSGNGIMAGRRICEAINAAGYRLACEFRAALDCDGPGTIAVEKLP